MSGRGRGKSVQKRAGNGTARQSKRRRGSSMPDAEHSNEVEVVQLPDLNDDGIAVDAGDSSHNSTGKNK